MSVEEEVTRQKQDIEDKIRAKSKRIEVDILSGLTSPSHSFESELDTDTLNGVFENLTLELLHKEEGEIKKLTGGITPTVRINTNTKFVQIRDNAPRSRQRLTVDNEVEIVHPSSQNLNKVNVNFSYVDGPTPCVLALEKNAIDVKVDGGLKARLSAPLIAQKVRKRVATPCPTIEETLTDRLRSYHGYRGNLRVNRLDLQTPDKLRVKISVRK